MVTRMAVPVVRERVALQHARAAFSEVDALLEAGDVIVANDRADAADDVDAQEILVHLDRRIQLRASEARCPR